MNCLYFRILLLYFLSNFNHCKGQDEDVYYVACQGGRVCVNFLECGNDDFTLPGAQIKDGSKCNVLQDYCCQTKVEKQCESSQACVPLHLCGPDGKISVFGSGLINKRIKIPLNPCTNENDPDSPSICCEKPVVDICPSGGVCVTENECKATGYDINNSQACNIPGGKVDNGICCSDLNVVKNSPKGCGYKNSRHKYQENVHLSENEAFFAEIPWQAIIYNSTYGFKCGAIIISELYLLTAAHCVEHHTLEGIVIRVGEYEDGSTDEPKEHIDLNAAKIHIHEKYSETTNRNGIALILLGKPLQFSYHINTLCLPTHDYLFYKPFTNYKDKSQSQECYASGWGKNKLQGQFQRKLKKLKLPLLESNYCQSLLQQTRLSRWFRLDMKSFLCAGGLSHLDTCKGDGGGPLYCWNNELNRYDLVGITSWGIGCAEEGVPGVYINVYNYLDWIREKMSEDFNYKEKDFINYGK